MRERILFISRWHSVGEYQHRGIFKRGPVSLRLTISRGNELSPPPCGARPPKFYSSALFREQRYELLTTTYQCLSYAKKEGCLRALAHFTKLLCPKIGKSVFGCPELRQKSSREKFFFDDFTQADDFFEGELGNERVNARQEPQAITFSPGSSPSRPFSCAAVFHSRFLSLSRRAFSTFRSRELIQNTLSTRKITAM